MIQAWISDYSSRKFGEGTLLISLYAVLIFISFTAFTCYALFYDPMRHIPGPIWARYIPGWLANHAIRGEMEESVLKAFKKYGDCVRIGPKTVMLGSPEAVQKVLGHGKNYQVKASDYNVLVVHTPSVFSEIDREKHARKRRIAAHAYSMQSVLKMEIYVKQTTEKFLNQVELYAKRGVPFDAVKGFKNFAFDVIGNLAYGKDFGMVENDSTAEFATNMERGLQFQFLLFHLPQFLRPIGRLITKLPVPFFNELRAGGRYMQKYSADLVRERWERQGTIDRPDILGKLIEARDPLTQERLTFADLATNSSTNVVAGADTVVVSLVGTLWNLLKTPGAAQTLTNEIRQNVPPGEIPEYASVSKLPYLDGCIKEGMRLLTAFSGPMPRVSPSGGLEIDGVQIPEGTYMNVMLSRVHQNELVFEEPLAFKPERWSGPDAVKLEHYFLGFSTGPRSCIGRNIAVCEMKVMLASLLQRFDIELAFPASSLKCERLLLTKVKTPVLINVKHATA